MGLSRLSSLVAVEGQVEVEVEVEEVEVEVEVEVVVVVFCLVRHCSVTGL
jgi:hypothetical protein